ncbi:2-oxoglutarate dehydrogenase E1 component [Coelomomyces lativittatus]|nr:2-oxoglutarate dehydrogenase E1 component [Coelomomyces lativittatus]KAJ1510302.1 2-oxoglutarate dehydrogenase E1 component [Coelomomyces lativittatus]KAJ1515769.1 2-oxoglutarate dehydrogenase E1 component [Coelomomyces lativittatus]
MSLRIFSSLARSSPFRLPHRINFKGSYLPCTSKFAFIHGRSLNTTASSSPLPVLPKEEAPESFAHGTAANYLDHMYEAWLKNPTSVHVSWQTYFHHVSQQVPLGQAFTSPPSLSSSSASTSASANTLPFTSLPSASSTAELSPTFLTSNQEDIASHLKVQLLARAFQVRGHHLAQLDPLDLNAGVLDTSLPPELDPSYYGFTLADMDRLFSLGPGMLPGYMSVSPNLPLRTIVQHLKDVYCGTLGIEYLHIPDRGQCDWLRQRLEIPNRIQFNKDEKKVILDRLIWSTSFEKFVASKYTSEKRFGLEGCEALIPGMKAMIDRAVENGIDNVVMGMPHRGRLNVLSNVVRKPNKSIFSEFSGSASEEGSGDVKYHLGMNYQRPTPSGKSVHLSLIANPSHLEAVNPVVEGKTRALQFYAGDKTKSKSMSVLLHGDAAFAGQGVVYETLGFSDLPSYTTGGTVHIIVNNQIGFTTDPRFSRSTPYCSDVAKTVGAPIFHVNGDDVEAVVFVCKLAADWRQKFHKDVVIDIVCYRKHGHNEVDQPAFTQPKMYQIISKKKSVLDLYTETLVQSGIFTHQEIEDMKSRVWNLLEESYNESKDYKPTSQEWVSSSWHGMKSLKDLASEVVAAKDTGCEKSFLEHIGRKASRIPEQFHAHPQVQRILKARGKTIEDGENIDWSTGEALAFGSLLMEKTHVRLSGQDVERGTFSQRHAVLHDQVTERQYVALNDLSPDQAEFSVSNSSLSEFGVLGFELGYSLVHPNSLVIWEAQFGDFSNNAQCIIDQFIASGEKKWHQRTGLVMNLPHGFDGQGPEHSSGRIERFLELCEESPFKFPTPSELARQIQDCNYQIAYPSTPANYFHLLRRQIHREFRKPLICFFSKSLLRHPLAKSSLKDMTIGTRFQRFLPDPLASSSQFKASDITTVLLCTGQVYYTLVKAREVNQVNHVVLGRLEQISPFPFDKVRDFVDLYPNARIVWVQEEPMNMGCWTYVQPRLHTVLRHSVHRSKVYPDTGTSPSGQPLSESVLYAGRAPSSSVATGKKKKHVHEEHQLISEALFGKRLKVIKEENGVPVFQV